MWRESWMLRVNLLVVDIGGWKAGIGRRRDSSGKRRLPTERDVEIYRATREKSLS